MKIFKTKFVSILSVFLLTLMTVQAQMVVTGNVTDPDGFSVSDAVVEVVSNPDISTFTDIDGNYSLSIPASAATDGQVEIRISSISMDDMVQTLDYQEGGELVQDFAFSNDSRTLSEVVAVGYGTIRKELATSAVEVIDTEGFNKGYVTNSDQLIQGKVAGVQISSSGSPQGGSTIRIRGGASLSASNDPLIIIDGLPLETGQGVSFLNPNDIESVSVLKDAASTAIYGARGANGVIIYTTKKGSKNKVSVNYNSQYSFNSMPYDYNQLSSGQYQDLLNNTDWAAVGLPNPNMLGVYNRPNDPSSGVSIYNTNWMDEVLKDAFSTNHNLSLKGNLFQKVPVRLSTAYTGNNGMLVTSKYQRWLLSLAANPSFFNNTLKVNINANTSSERFRFADEGQISAALRFDPTKPVRYDGLSRGNGYFEWLKPNGEILDNAPANPYAALVQTNKTQFSRRYFGNIQLDYTFPFLTDLRFIINGGMDEDHWRGTNNKEVGAVSSFLNGNGQLENYNGFALNKSLDTYFVYNKGINNLDMEFTAGYSYQTFYKREFNTGNRVDPANAPARIGYPDNNNYTMVGFFGRLNFNYLSKYLLYINFRYDGTSKFSKDNRWQSFPGVSFGWVMSKEEFMQGITFVNNLKLRASFGVTGNQSVPAYQFLPLYNLGNTQSAYPIGDQSYIPVYPLYYSPNLKWETTNDWNIGLDYTIWNRRIEGSFDYYNKTTKDLLASVNIPAGSNFANIGLVNLGEFEAEGVDIGLSVDAIQKEYMNLNFGFNASYNKREVLQLGDSERVAVDGIGGLIGQNITYHNEGYSPNAFWVFKQVYDANGRPIQGAYVDRNGDNVINDEDRYYYKNPWPKWSYGFNTTFNYKDFSFNMSWRAQTGNYIYNNLKSNHTFLSEVPGSFGYNSNITDDYYSNGFIQKDVKPMQSDYFIENGSFLKLDNLTLAYDIRNFISPNNSLTVSLSGNNLLIITDSTAEDPEVYNGIYYNLYPRPRMYVLGFNLNF